MFSSCADQPAEVECQSCLDVFCEVCFAAQHRKGSRKVHSVRPLHSRKEEAVKMNDKPTSTRTKVNSVDAPVLSLSLIMFHVLTSISSR